MEDIRLAATERSPEVVFDFAAHRLSLVGESYPEDASAFYGPLLAALRGYLAESRAAPLAVRIVLRYFNSSSCKALLNLFRLLDRAAGEGRPVVIDWCFHPDDDTLREFGEDFAEDIQHAHFHLRPE
jgi:hypothetical protein